MSFSVPILIKMKGESPVSSHFCVYLKKYPPEQLERSDEFYIRSGIWILGVPAQLHDFPIRSLLVAEDETVAKFLRDAEPPAHIEWVKLSKDLEKYENAVKTLRFIKRSVKEIVSVLNQPPPGGMYLNLSI